MSITIEIPEWLKNYAVNVSKGKNRGEGFFTTMVNHQQLDKEQKQVLKTIQESSDMKKLMDTIFQSKHPVSVLNKTYFDYDELYPGVVKINELFKSITAVNTNATTTLNNQVEERTLKQVLELLLSGNYSHIELRNGKKITIKEEEEN